MPITIKGGAEPRRRNIASLVGGFVIAFGCFVLWLLVARQLGHDGTATILLGAALCAAIGVWIRIADL